MFVMVLLTSGQLAPVFIKRTVTLRTVTFRTDTHRTVTLCAVYPQFRHYIFYFILLLGTGFYACFILFIYIIVII